MKSLAEIHRGITLAFERRSRRMHMSSFFVKVVLIAAGTGVVTLSQFWTLQADENPTAWNYIGTGAALLVFIGALLLFLGEQDPSIELNLAREATERALDQEQANAQVWQQVEAYSESVDRLTELFTAYTRMRDVLERVAIKGAKDSIEVVDMLMKAAARHLTIGMGFQHSDDWTLAVYQAIDLPDGPHLLCRAHERAIRCDISEARPWPTGVGVGGVAYATREKKIVPDMQAEGIGNIYGVAGTKPYDTARYRSIVAIPIFVGHDPKPWGIVIGTSSQPLHFMLKDSERPDHAMGAETLAAMVALAVALTTGAARAPQGGQLDGQKPVSADS